MEKSLQRFQFAAPIGSLEAYIHWANQVPMLSPEEEKQLAGDLYYKGDLEAARRLVLSHLRFVIRIAKGYAGYGLPQADLIQEGNIGLMKAVKRFNPEVGVRLVSFAIHWIKAEIHEFILKNWKIVKFTTKAQRKLFFNLRKATKHLTWFTTKEVADLAKDLNVSEKEVRSMEARLNLQDEAFDPIPNEDDNGFQSPVHCLEDHSADPAKKLEIEDWSENREQKLHYAISHLDARSQDILKRRWLVEEEQEKATLHELAKEYKVSAERIRQLEKNAMNKIKETIQ